MTRTLELNNGVTMPALGFGVFQTPPDETVSAVASALGPDPASITPETFARAIPEA